MDLGVEIAFNGRHQIANEGLERRERLAIFGRQDEPRLVTIAITAFGGLHAVRFVGPRAIETRRRSISFNTVSLDVGNVRRPTSNS